MVGVNDVKYAGFLPVPLTTLRQPCDEIGAAARSLMLDRRAQPKGPRATSCSIANSSSASPAGRNRRPERRGPVV